MTGSSATESWDWQVCRFAQDEGARLLFPSVYPDNATPKEALLHVVRRDPHQVGIDCSRWTLQQMLEHCSWLHCHTQAGLWQVLDRLDIHYERGCTYLHSPDPAYEEKLARIEQLKSS